jgi:hypothetical protein
MDKEELRDQKCAAGGYAIYNIEPNQPGFMFQVGSDQFKNDFNSPNAQKVSRSVWPSGLKAL